MNSSRLRIGLLLLAFTFSGAAGLILQLVWTLTVSTLYGVSAHAIATILAAFMGGLALGSWLGARILARSSTHALTLYAVSEVVVAIGAIGLHWLFDQSQGLAPLFATLLPGSEPISLSIRWLILTGLFLIPTSAMGASFPFLCRGLTQDNESPVARLISLAYGANVLGAAVGCIATSQILLMAIGVWNSVLLASALNVVAAAIAWSMTKWTASSGESSPRESTKSILSNGVLAGLIGVSGASAMAFEVVWSRMVRQALWLANPFQAFAQVLSGILIGMAAGALLLAVVRLSQRRALYLFGWIQWSIAILCILGITQLRWELAQFWAGDLTRLYRVLSVGILGAGALLLGMGFPLLASVHPQSSARLGRLYAGSALGGVIGTLTGGFVLIPVLGVRLSLLVLAAGFIITGGLALGIPHWSRVGRTFLWTVRLAVMSLMMVVGLGHLTQDQLDFQCDGCSLLWLNDGLEATTAVVRTPSGEVTLYTDGRSITPGALPQRTLTALMIAPEIDRVLSIGFGSGQLAEMVARGFPDTQFDCVELDGNMAKTTDFFGTSDLLSLPNFELYVDDGRQHLLRSPKAYDVIIADTFTHSINTQIYGAGFFSVARRSLTSNGSFFITVPLQDLPSVNEAEIILRTAFESFPFVYVLAPQGMVAILGRTQPLDWASGIRTLPQSLAGELSFELSADDVYLLEDSILNAFVTERVNSDDHPYFFPLTQHSSPTVAQAMHAQIRALGGLATLDEQSIRGRPVRPR